MAKISEETRLHFQECIQPYKDKITQTLEKEKTMRNAMHDGDIGLEYKKLLLCEDMIYVASLYVAQNSLSLKLMEVKITMLLMMPVKCFIKQSSTLKKLFQM